jgi:hypothetical protein
MDYIDLILVRSTCFFQSAPPRTDGLMPGVWKTTILLYSIILFDA